ncbi:MAG: hypothetical protein M3Y86_11755 [Verrucomicrobiota bacterium]|nr:hypothetical protein [Verrucomicrobiota bacterium]
MSAPSEVEIPARLPERKRALAWARFSALGLPPFFSRSGATTVARLAAVGMLLGVMAIGSRRLTREQFGLWAIFYTLMNFAPTMDLGFRYSVGNRLAALKARPDANVERQDTFLAVFHFELLVGIAGFVLCWLVLSLFDWAAVFHITNPAFAHQTAWLFPIVCGMLMLNQPFSIAASAFFADQQIELASALAVIQSVLLLAVFWLASLLGSYPALVLAFFGVYLLAGLATTLLLFHRLRWRWHWPAFTFQAATIRSLRKTSLDFFALSASAMAASTVGPLLVGTVASVQAAGDFTLLQRIFNLLVTLHLAVLAPLAPAYTMHAQQGDWPWVKKRLRDCVRIVWPLLFVAGATGLLIAHPLLMRVWSGHWLSNYPLATLLALTAILGGWANTYSIVLNSLGAVRVQAILAFIMLAPVILLPAFLGRAFGTVGVALASCLCTLPSCVVCWLYARRVLDRQLLRV